MAGTELKIISSCAWSPFFKCTRDRTVNYGDCSGRLTPLSLGRGKIEEYWTQQNLVKTVTFYMHHRACVTKVLKSMGFGLPLPIDHATTLLDESFGQYLGSFSCSLS